MVLADGILTVRNIVEPRVIRKKGTEFAIDHNRNRVFGSKECLAFFNRNPN